MRYEIIVGRDWRVIQCDDNGVIEYIDGSPVSDIDEYDTATCTKALARHLIDEGYNNSQDLAGMPDKEAYKVEQNLDERRGK